MRQSCDIITNMIKNVMYEETYIQFEDYLLDVLNRNFIEFADENQVKNVFSDYLVQFYNNNSFSNVEKIRYYTGIAYKYVNSILRNTWDYDSNGLLTEEKEKNYKSLSNDISYIIRNNNPINYDFKVYRGVNISSFSEYGIHSLEELVNMKNQYYLENAFTSTSLIRKESFFDRDLEWHDSCNIEIEYMIPCESNDGMPLIDDNLSYSKKQNEFLINKGSVSKIVDVRINSEKTKAYVKAILVPQKILDQYMQNNINVDYRKK